MALKIIQDNVIPRLSATAGVAVTSVPIALKTGYLRITIGSSTGSAGGYIAIGTNPVATQDSFHVTAYSVDIIKVGMRRASIVGVVTGPTTKFLFDENAGNPFVGTSDYVTISGAPTAGLNTSHNAILNADQTSLTINYDSSSITNPNVYGAVVSKSVKVSAISYESGNFFNISEVVTLVSE